MKFILLLYCCSTRFAGTLVVLPNLDSASPGWGLLCWIACWAPPYPLMPHKASRYPN